MNRKIYREIAKKNGLSAKEVKQEMQAAIDETYKNPNPAALEIRRINGLPTIDEFICHTIKQIKDEKH